MAIADLDAISLGLSNSIEVDMDGVDDLFGNELAPELALPMARAIKPRLCQRIEEIRGRGCRRCVHKGDIASG